jgi:hypothetical protein
MSIDKIIRACGGAKKVAEGSLKTDSPVTFEAVYKWYRNGIPDAHWPLVMELGDVTSKQIFDANRVAEHIHGLTTSLRRLRRQRLMVKALSSKAA